MTPEDRERLKREEADQYSLPYPVPHNRAQRRANERVVERRRREEEIQKAISQASFRWKKDWMKTQKRKGGAKRRKK